jgi:hypothetical protein
LVTGLVTELTTDPTALVTGLPALVAVGAAVEVADEAAGVDPVTAETVDVIGPRAEGWSSAAA